MSESFVISHTATEVVTRRYLSGAVVPHNHLHIVKGLLTNGNSREKVCVCLYFGELVGELVK